MRRILLSLLLILPAHIIFSQVNIRDSSAVIPVFQMSFGVYAPVGDMAENYGANFSVGGSFFVKTKKNNIWGFDGDFLFGGNVKDEDAILERISTEQGWVIDVYGFPATISIYERGFRLTLKGGKLIPVFGPNPNSGLLITLGAGYMQHRTRIENTEKTVPQIQDDYEKGYDRLCGGPALNQFIGYMHLGNNRTVNFIAGIDLTQAWTSSLRPYDFNLMGKDESGKFDMLFGLKVAWMVPIYRKAPDQYYYY